MNIKKINTVNPILNDKSTTLSRPYIQQVLRMLVHLNLQLPLEQSWGNCKSFEQNKIQNATDNQVG